MNKKNVEHKVGSFKFGSFKFFLFVKYTKYVC